MKKGLVLGSTKGIGRAFLEAARGCGFSVEQLGKQELDTSADYDKLSEMMRAQKISGETFDLVVLNTGGMPPLEIKENEILGEAAAYQRAMSMYCFSFISLLNQIVLSEDCIVIYISSHVIHNRERKLAHSAVARAAGETLVHYLPVLVDNQRLRCWSLRFGPVATERLTGLLEDAGKDIVSFAKELPRLYVGSEEDVKKLASYLLSDASNLLANGQIDLDVGIGNKLTS